MPIMPNPTIKNGTAGNDTLYSTTGYDILNGLGGDDNLYGGVGNNDLVGGDGNDSYFIDADVAVGVNRISEFTWKTNPFNSTPTMTATNGIDALNFGKTTTKAINVNLSTTTLQTVATGVDLIIPIENIEDVYGGSLNDTIFGNYLRNKLSGGAGNDTIDGGAGNDILDGGAGDDTLRGGAGNDTLYGGDGNDTLGEQYNLYGGDNRDTLYGGDGNDTLYGEELYGGSGNDTLYPTINGPVSYVNGGEGDDIIYGGYGIYYEITGGRGNDSFVPSGTYAGNQYNRIDDFTSGEDKIVLRKSIFQKIAGAVGGLIGGDFAIVNDNDSVSSSTSSAAILYSKGTLFYNTNGSAPGVGYNLDFVGNEIATLQGRPLLTANDFSIIA